MIKGTKIKGWKPKWRPAWCHEVKQLLHLLRSSPQEQDRNPTPTTLTYLPPTVVGAEGSQQNS